MSDLHDTPSLCFLRALPPAHSRESAYASQHGPHHELAKSCSNFHPSSGDPSQCAGVPANCDSLEVTVGRGCTPIGPSLAARDTRS